MFAFLRAHRIPSFGMSDAEDEHQRRLSIDAMDGVMFQASADDGEGVDQTHVVVDSMSEGLMMPGTALSSLSELEKGEPCSS